MKVKTLFIRNVFAASVMLLMLAFGSNVTAAVTSLLLQSDPGDYIGGGQTLFFSPTDGTFTAQRNLDNGVSVAFTTPSLDHFWYLDFAAPFNQFLTVGSYQGAVRFPFQGTDQPGLDVYGDGRGCNTLTGSFNVLEVTYGLNDDVTSFRATFEQHCEGDVPALRGEIRFNADIIVDLTAPTSLSVAAGQNLTFNVTATDNQGRHVALTATGLPSGAAFTDNGDNTGTFNWTPTIGQVGSYLVAFHGDNGQGDTETVFTGITVIPPPPTNDDFNNAIVVPGVPFTFTEDTRTATAAADDPFCTGQSATVWFAFTPSTDMTIEANTSLSGYDTTLSAYTGTRGALTQVACNDDSGGTSQSKVRFDAHAGVTYYFMVSAYGSEPGGNLVFNVIFAPPPLTISLFVNRFGSVVPTSGMATVSGTVKCSSPTFVNIFGELKQHTTNVLSGFFFAFIACDGTTPWNATVQLPPLTLFHGRAVSLFVAGQAGVTASAFAFDPDTGEQAQSNATVNVFLRGSH